MTFVDIRSESGVPDTVVPLQSLCLSGRPGAEGRGGGGSTETKPRFLNLRVMGEGREEVGDDRGKGVLRHILV